MGVKKDAGIVMSDITIAIIIVVAFTGLITGLMFSVWFSNFKAQRNGMAAIYLAQKLEEVAITEYDLVTNQTFNINNGNESDTIASGYIVKQEILEEKKDQDDRGIKKVKETISYNVGNKQYEKSIVRFKVEE